MLIDLGRERAKKRGRVIEGITKEEKGTGTVRNVLLRMRRRTRPAKGGESTRLAIGSSLRTSAKHGKDMVKKHRGGYGIERFWGGGRDQNKRNF